MPSPFPGMDPYLEAPAIWEDFHANLAGEIQAQLAPKISPHYIAALIPRVSYEEIIIGERPVTIKPDVSILQIDQQPFSGTATAIAPAPLTAPVVEEIPVKLWSVEIKRTDSGTLVTAIEILSPVNKRRGHQAYLDYQRKRRTLRRQGVHLLEIDLLRQGERFPVQEVKLPDTPYFVFLQRAITVRVEIWPVPLLESIPLIPVPLKEPDPDVPLDLNLAIRSVYDRAYYQLRINYDQPPPKPNLSSHELAWLEARLKASEP